jgi:hypothetical protein
MIDDCQLAEAIFVLFTVLSTLAWRLDHCIVASKDGRRDWRAFVRVSH